MGERMSFEIYYLDDEVDLLEIFSDTFSSEDVKIKTFSDPSLFILEVNKNNPDLVFMDFRLPHITGDEIALKLNKEIPKAIISGDLNLALKSDIEDVFEKPYDVKKICDFINKLKKRD